MTRPGDAPSNGSPERRAVWIDCDLTATCDGQSAMQIRGDGGGVLQIEVTGKSIPSVGRVKARQAFQAAKLMVTTTGQTLEISIDGTPSLRLSPSTKPSGQVVAKTQILKLSKLFSASLRQLGWIK